MADFGKALLGFVSGAGTQYLERSKEQREWERKNLFLENEHKKNIELAKLREQLSLNTAKETVKQQHSYDVRYSDGKPVERGEEGFAEAMTPDQLKLEADKERTEAYINKPGESEREWTLMEERFKRGEITKAQWESYKEIKTSQKNRTSLTSIEARLSSIRELQLSGQITEEQGKQATLEALGIKSEGTRYDTISADELAKQVAKTAEELTYDRTYKDYSREELMAAAREIVTTNLTALGISVGNTSKEKKGRSIVRTGIDKATGKKVIKYSDGSIEYVNQ